MQAQCNKVNNKKGLVRSSVTSRALPRNAKIRRGKGKRIKPPLHICARTLKTMATIATSMVTPNKNVGSYIQSLSLITHKKEQSKKKNNILGMEAGKEVESNSNVDYKNVCHNSA